MNDAVFVCGFQGFGNLRRDRDCLPDRESAAVNALLKRWPFDELHHESRDAFALFEAVNLRDVRVIQRRERFGFALEPRQPARVLCYRLG